MDKRITAVIAVVIIVVVIVAGLDLAGYFTPKKTTVTPKGNTLTIASSALPVSYDPAVAYDTISVFFDDQMYQTLLGYGTTTNNGQTVGSLTPVPELATSWTVNTNGSVLFNLRQNVTFSNGDAFNASAVNFSLNRIITMGLGDSFHVADFLKPSGIHIINKYQILLVPSAPYPWFLNLFQLWVTDIVDPSFVTSHGGVTHGQENQYMNNHTMGTGPYVLNSTSLTDIVMKANPHYWGPQPNVTTINFEIVSSSATQLVSLEQGSVNIALQIPLDQMSTVANHTNLKVKAGPTSSEYYIGLNENVTPFNNLDVRMAMNYALNVSYIVDYSTFGYGLQLHNVMAPTVESYIPAFQNYTYNLTKAQKLLTAAGYSHGFSTSFYYTSGDPIGQSIASIVQSELAQINITVSIQDPLSTTFDKQAGQGTYPMFYDGWVNLLATPDDGLRPLFSAHNLGIGGNYNYFNNSTVTSLLSQAGTLYNQSQRDAMYQQVQNILAQQAVEVPLFNLQNVIPMTNNVHNLYVYPTFDIFVDQITMT